MTLRLPSATYRKPHASKRQPETRRVKVCLLARCAQQEGGHQSAKEVKLFEENNRFVTEEEKIRLLSFFPTSMSFYRPWRFTLG